MYLRRDITFDFVIEVLCTVCDHTEEQAEQCAWITHYKGKTEVAAVTNEPVPGVKGGENGVVVFKLLRGAADASNRAKVTIVGRNPEAIWFSGYDDRVVVDEAELYSMYDIPAITAVAAE